MTDIRACIVSVGDELLYGHITNTNSQWLSDQLSTVGFSVAQHITVGDSYNAIHSAIHTALSESDCVVLTGGLGPTRDDLTKSILVDYFECQLVENKKVLAHIEQLFTSKGQNITELDRSQALIPEAAEPLDNEFGTAPGLWIAHNSKILIALPGVPSEMKQIVQAHALPRLKSYFNFPTILHYSVRTVGLYETQIAQSIADWEQHLPVGSSLAYLPSLGTVKLRLTLKGEDEQVLDELAKPQIAYLKKVLGKSVYSDTDLELPAFIGQLLAQLQKTVATAESCTGGMLASSFTQQAGSSQYFIGGMIAYSNEVKVNDLGVLPETLAANGAVSEATAKEMAQQIRLKYKTDIGLATTGIAGPTGEAPGKPVGTVFIAYADHKGVIVKRLQLKGNRLYNIQQTCIEVLNLLRIQVLGLE